MIEPNEDYQCPMCDTKTSEIWWKCCPEHSPDDYPVPLCASCVLMVHGLCVMQGCNNLGVQSVDIQFGCFDDTGFKIYTDKSRSIYLCREHKGSVLIIEPQL